MKFYKLQKWLKYLALKQSIKRMGIIIPIIITSDNTVLDGKTRCRIAKELGMQIPVIALPFEIEYRDPNDLVDLLEEFNGMGT